MPPAVVQSAAFNYAPSPAPITFSSNVTSGNLIVVHMFTDQGIGSRSCTDSQSNAYTEIALQNNTAVGQTSIWWTVVSATGSLTVTAACGGNMGVVYYELSGLATTTPVDQSNTATNASAVPIVGPNYTGLSSTSDYVVYWALYNNPGSNAIGGIWTGDYRPTISGGHYACVAYAFTGTSVTAPTIDPGISSAFVMSTAAFKPTAGGGTVTGTASIPLGPLTTTSTSINTVKGTVTAALGPLTLTATSVNTVVASPAVPLGPLTLTSTGGAVITGTSSLPLGPLSLTATGASFTFGVVITLGPLTLTATTVEGGGGGFVYVHSTPRVTTTLSSRQL